MILVLLIGMHACVYVCMYACLYVCHCYCSGLVPAALVLKGSGCLSRRSCRVGEQGKVFGVVWLGITCRESGREAISSDV